MKRQLHRERGTATIEMAVVTMLSIVILAMIVLAGRLTWYAIALTKGVANTNRIVATLPRATLVADADVLEAFVKDTLYDATESAGIDIQPRGNSIAVLCGMGHCDDKPFVFVLVTATIDFRDTIFDSDFHHVIPEALTISSISTQTYATTFPAVSTN